MRVQTLRVAALAVGAILFLGGCAWDATSNLPSASDSAVPTSAAAPTPQIPESMKTGTVTGDTNDQPVFRGSL